MTDERSHTSLRPCPVCNACLSIVISDMEYALFDDLDIPSHKALVQCNGCGTLYDDTRLTEHDLERYYAANSHFEFVGSGKLGALDFESDDRMDRILELLLAAQPSTRRFLDFGCSRGSFLRRCRERGFDQVAGVELGNNARQNARDAGLNVAEKLDDLVGFEPDAVILSHVLEHLLHPRDILKSLAHFAPDTLIYIEVPDAEKQFLESKVDWDRFYFEHIVHFTGTSLRTLCASCGIATVADGQTTYSRDLPIPCRWILGILPRHGVPKESPPGFAGKTYAPLSPPGGDAMSPLLTRTDTLSIWGVSQYAMLLIGSRIKPSGKTLHRLFDTSPAKIGRRIDGIEIEPSSRIGTLTETDTLLIPKSGFLTSMVGILPEYGFKGRVEIV